MRFSILFLAASAFSAVQQLPPQAETNTTALAPCPNDEWAAYCQHQRSTPSGQLKATDSSTAEDASTAESGSWCYKPKNEPFWGAATGDCCAVAGGRMHSNRRCFGMSVLPNRCRRFYACCIADWRSDNNGYESCR